MAVEGAQRTLGDEYPHALIALGNMGMVFVAWRRCTEVGEAEALGAEALGAEAVHHAPQRHPFRLAALVQHGLTLVALKRFQDGEEALRDGWLGLARTSGLRSRQAMEPVQGMVELYDAWYAVKPDKGHDAKAVEQRLSAEQCGKYASMQKPSVF